MKTLVTICALFCITCANATVITVSNNLLTAGQYTTLAAAYAAANVGDTLYIHGSPTSYGTLTIRKRLTLIGAGYNDSTSFSRKTMLGLLSVDSVVGTIQVSGTKIIGIELLDYVYVSNVNHVTISRCKITNSVTVGGTGCVLEHNMLASINAINVGTLLVKNNFIHGSIAAAGDVPGLLIDHNIIQGVINSLEYAVITNNVFFGTTIEGGLNTYCNFSNNMAIYSSLLAFPTGTNSGSGNVSALYTNYQFYHTLVAASGYPARLAFNWRLLPTSLGHNAATDGTDMGMYGGTRPMPNFTGASEIFPQMTMMNINNPNVPAGTPLNVHFKARKIN